MDSENIPYRSAVDSHAPSVKEDKARDQLDIGTLKRVQHLIDENINALYKNFNAFELLDPKYKAEDVLIDIKARQMAYDILVPIRSEINGAVDDVEKVKE